MAPDASHYAIVVSSLLIPGLPHPSTCCLWSHPHYLALAPPLHCHNHCPAASWSQAHFDALTTLPGAIHSSISSTCTKRRVLECHYGTLFRHCTGPGTSSNTGCGTKALVTPTSVTMPVFWMLATETFWTWDGPMGTMLSPSTYVSI